MRRADLAAKGIEATATRQTWQSNEPANNPLAGRNTINKEAQKRDNYITFPELKRGMRGTLGDEEGAKGRADETDDIDVGAAFALSSGFWLSFSRIPSASSGGISTR